MIYYCLILSERVVSASSANVIISLLTSLFPFLKPVYLVILQLCIYFQSMAMNTFGYKVNSFPVLEEFHINYSVYHEALNPSAVYFALTNKHNS